jgi:uncharacterized protein YndB with AHSA1/START domain
VASGELTLELDRTLPAPRSRVFEAFADPGRLASWWGPEGFDIPRVRFEPAVGEPYRIEMQPPTGEPFHVAGEFTAVDPPGLLAFSFRWDPPDPDDVENLVQLTFRDAGDGTELSLVQGPFRTEERRALHRDGWTDSLDKLEALLSSG